MGIISELFDVISLSRKAQNQMTSSGNKDYSALSSAFTKAKSISSRASKYIMEYPVACSTLVSSYDTALAITKQIEFDCARFIILSAGLNPVVKSGSGDTIETHINDLVSSYESYSGVNVSILPATEDYINAGQEYVNKYLSQEEYRSFNKLSDISKPIFSTELKSQDVDIDNSSNIFLKPVREFIKTHTYAEIKESNAATAIGCPRPADNEGGPDWDDAAEYSAEAQNTEVSNMYSVNNTADVLSKLGKTGPTIVTLKLFIHDGNGASRPIDVPLAIKATLQFVESRDIKDILLGVNIKGRKLLNFIKMTTGQISFFKDWLLAIDTTKKDIDREKTIGNTPFFRRLLNNKAKYRLKSISEFIPFLKNIIAKKTQSDLPMCTLIVDESEFSTTTACRLSNCLNNRQKFIDPFLDEYMLLGLGIVDSTNDVLHLFYSGEERPISVKISDLGASGSGTSNIASSLASAVSNMSRLITKH